MKFPKLFSKKIQQLRKSLFLSSSKSERKIIYKYIKGTEIMTADERSAAIKLINAHQHGPERDFDSFIHKIRRAQPTRNAEQTYKKYLKELRQLNIEPLNIRVPLLGAPKGILNKSLLRKLIGKTQQKADSCGSAVLGLASQFIKGGKRISDKRIVKERELLKHKLAKEILIGKDYNLILKKLEENKILGVEYFRISNIPLVSIQTLKNEYVNTLGKKYLIAVETPTFNDKAMCTFLMNNKQEALKFAKKVQHVKRAKSCPYLETKSERLFLDNPVDIFTLGKLMPALPPEITHHAFIVGAREFNGKRYVTVYDQNYKRAKVPAVYEIPFNWCKELFEYTN